MIKQAYHLHYALHAQRVPIDHYIEVENPQSPEAKKLRFIKKLLKFAKANGLKVGDAYQYVVDTKTRHISYLVYAAYPLRLAAKQTWFPIVGKVPYLGYFSKDERDEVAGELAHEGFDIYKAVVGGFSSLGWWDDPIYIQMLRRDRIELADLIFHELTHKTFWIPDAAVLNENLAEFIALKMSEDFFSRSHELREQKEIRQRKTDRVTYVNWLKNNKEKLRAIFADKNTSRLDKLKRKKEAYLQMNLVLPRFLTKGFDYLKKKKWNNAAMVAASLYAPDMKLFEKSYKCSGVTSAGAFLTILENKMQDRMPFEQTLKRICESTHGGRITTPNH